MLDNILNSVKRGAERVQRRGEEVAQVARLKMEVFQLNRELDGHYARLGRSFHSGADVDLLQGIREDIRRVEGEISAREKLIEELGSAPEVAEDDQLPARPVQITRVSESEQPQPDQAKLDAVGTQNSPSFTPPKTDAPSTEPHFTHETAPKAPESTEK